MEDLYDHFINMLINFQKTLGTFVNHFGENTMALYEVKIPIAGSITFEIEADSESNAITEAFNTDADKGDVEWDTKVYNGYTIVRNTIYVNMGDIYEIGLLEDRDQELYQKFLESDHPSYTQWLEGLVNQLKEGEPK